MRFFSFLVIFFWLLSSVALAGISEKTKDISALTASYLYDYDQRKLPIVLESFLASNEDILALEIKDGYTHEVMVSYYKQDDEKIFNQSLPEAVQKLEKLSFEIKYNNDLVGQGIVYYEAEISTELSEDEKSWLEENPVIRIAAMDYWPSDNNGNNLHTDVIKLINKYIGTNIVIIRYSAWKDGFKDASEGKKIHGILGLSYSKEREEKYFHYSQPYNFTPSYLIVKNKSKLKSLNELEGKSVYLKSKSILYRLIEEQFKSVKVLHSPTVEELYQDFHLSKKASALLTYYKEDDLIKHYGLKIVDTLYDKYGEVAVGVHHNYPELRSIIDKAFRIIPKTELAAIRNKKYVSQNELNLTPEEEVWLKEHPTIKVHNEINWAPMNFNKNGAPGGYSIEYMNLLAKKTGLKVEYVTGEWNDLYNQTINKKIDVMLNIVKTKERENFLLFTAPYQKNKIGIYAKKESTMINSIESLNGKKVAIVDGFFQEAILREHYPLIQILRVENSEESLKAVCEGRADATMGSFLVMGNLINEIMCYEVEYKSEFKIDRDLDLRIGVRNDYLLLQSILQKAMATVGSNELNALRKKWIGQSDEKKTVSFTDKELTWMQKHPVIHVGGEMDWAPIDFVDDSGKYSGLAKDYLDFIAQKTGLKFDITTGQSWETLLESLKAGRLDMLPAIYSNEKRKKIFHFTKPYLAMSDYYITKEDTPTISKIEALFGKKVSVVESYAVADWLAENYPEIETVRYKSILEALRAVQSDEAYAMINDNPSTTHIMEKNFITTLKINNIVKNRPPALLHMAVKRGYAPLSSIIDKTLGSMTREEKKEISERWMSQISSEAGSIDFTEDELAWISTKPVIHFAVDPKWLPIEAINEESRRYEGMMADLLKKIEESSGITFRLVPTEQWSDSVELAKSGKVDMLAAVSRTKEREKYLYFSSPTIELSDGVIMQSDAKFITKLNDLEGMRVGISDGTSIHAMLKEKYPQLILVPIKGTYNGVRALEDKKIDAYVGNLEVIGYLIQKEGIFNLKVALRMDKKRQLHIALLKNMPMEALSIINKALAEISPEEMDTIRQRWVGLKVTESVDYSLLWKIGLGVFAIFLFGAYSNYRLKKMVNAKTADIQRQKEELAEFNRNLEAIVKERTTELSDEREFVNSVMDSLRSLVITTDSAHIRRVNQAFLDFFGVKTLEEFQKDHKSICDFFIPQTSGEYLQKTMPSGLSWIQHVVRYGSATHKVVIEWQGVQYVFAVNADMFVFSGEGLFVVTLTDISEMEKIRQEVEELHQLTKDSIEYSSLIQHAIIPSNNLFRDYFADYFTIWHPRDVVGGDIYLFEELRNENECLLMIIDCTGHGVPGAFVTMLVKAIERQMVSNIINSDEEVHPAKLLSIYNRSMKHLLQQDQEDAISNAGFDGGILYYNKEKQLLRYAGAETPLFMIQDGKMEVFKGDRHSVGYVKSNPDYEYSELEFEAVPGMQLYVSTDGFLDQNGGEKGFPLGKKRFVKFLETYHHESYANQQERLLYFLKEYQGEEERNDDVTVIGLKIA